MYIEGERVHAMRFRCKTCGKTFTVLPEGVTYYKTGQQTLDAFFDLGDLPFSGIIIIDERWLPMGNGIFHFGCTAFDGITGRTILAERQSEDWQFYLKKNIRYPPWLKSL